MNLEPLRKRLADLAKTVGDFRPAWPAVDRFTSRVMRLQFATEGSHLLGEKWAPWTEKWKRYRVRPGGGRGGIGRDTNTMWGSFTKPRSPLSITREDPQEYERGSIVPYAQFFQRRRPVWPEKLPERVESAYLGLIVKHLDKGAA